MVMMTLRFGFHAPTQPSQHAPYFRAVLTHLAPKCASNFTRSASYEEICTVITRSAADPRQSLEKPEVVLHPLSLPPPLRTWAKWPR